MKLANVIVSWPWLPHPGTQMHLVVLNSISGHSYLWVLMSITRVWSLPCTCSASKTSAWEFCLIDSQIALLPSWDTMRVSTSFRKTECSKSFLIHVSGHSMQSNSCRVFSLRKSWGCGGLISGQLIVMDSKIAAKKLLIPSLWVWGTQWGAGACT